MLLVEATMPCGARTGPREAALATGVTDFATPVGKQASGKEYCSTNANSRKVKRLKRAFLIF
jgi:hypothetical protein